MDAITTPAPASEAPGDEHILLIPEDVAVYFEAADTNELTWPFAWWFYGVQLMLRVTLSPDGFTVERGFGSDWLYKTEFDFPVSVEALENLLIDWSREPDREL